MSNGDDRLIGEIHATVKILDKRTEATEAKVDKILAGEAPCCERHERDITAIKRVLLWLLLGGGATGAVAKMLAP